MARELNDFVWIESVETESTKGRISVARVRVSVAASRFVAMVAFVAAHPGLLIGISTPQKFVFDGVHYVLAAKQMLEAVMPRPMRNPTHPPLAKQLIAASIRTFGDRARGRPPSEADPGHPGPDDAAMVEMRQVDRKRRPKRCVAPIVVAVRMTMARRRRVGIA
jgi:hypothetical protein